MKIAVGLSGGVDSAVAALLLKEAGHAVTGVTMKLWHPDAGFKGGAAGSCFGPDEDRNIAAATALAARIGIPYRVFDCHAAYVREVVDYFRTTYLAGHTPNPCVQCNARVKFGLLPRLAAEGGLVFDRFATGHYARIAAQADGRLALLRGCDLRKDQSYFLCRLSQEQLARTLFPLGEMTKDAVRARARAAGLALADRPDSQDFYAGGKDELIGAPDRPGEIVDTTGRVLGRHNGFWHYTIGQRKGLGIGGAGDPWYVVALNACANRVVVGRRDEAMRTSFRVTEMNWVSIAPTSGPLACRVKIRSTGEPRGPAVLTDGVCEIPTGVQGVAPGQSAVFYDPEGERVLAGGIIG